MSRSSPLVRVFRVSWRVMELGQQVWRGLWVGLWLGLLSERRLVQLDEAGYDDSAFYHSSEHNLGGLFAWEREIVEADFPTKGRVLVLGAGAGREAFALERAGFEVAAYECHAGLRATGDRLATESGLTTRLRRAERDRMAPVEGPFDAAVVGWGMLTQVRHRSVRIRLLADLAAALQPGAPVLVSFLGRSGNCACHRTAATTGVSVRACFGRFWGVPTVERGDFLQPHFGHYFTADEVQEELGASGFDGARVQLAPYPHAVASAQAE